MIPSDRLMTSVRQLVRVLSMRTCSVIACMMTEALDVQGIHVSYKVRCWCVLQGMLLVSLTRYAAGVSYRVPTGPGILEMSWNLK